MAASSYGVLVVGVGGGGGLRAEVESRGWRSEAAAGAGPGGEPWVLSAGRGRKRVGGEEEVMEARRVVEVESGGEGHGWRCGGDRKSVV